MNEVAAAWHEVTGSERTHDDGDGDATFAGFVGRLEEETVRLRSLAEAFETTARELASREASLDAREHSLKGAQREIDGRWEELKRRQQELERLAAQTEDANARIAEATERQVGLRALANDLLRRYSDRPVHV